jgi:hypothetical protein
MTKERDTQRAKVYKTDHALDDISQQYATIEDIRRFLRDTCRRQRVQAEFPCTALLAEKFADDTFRIHDGGGTRIARGGYSRLNFPRWSRYTGVVLHELAHVIHAREEHSFGRDRELMKRDGYKAAHGWRFMQIYLRLVLHAMGRTAHDKLKAAAKANKVRIAPKRKISPEQLEALRERGKLLMAARHCPAPDRFA